MRFIGIKDSKFKLPLKNHLWLKIAFPETLTFENHDDFLIETIRFNSEKQDAITHFQQGEYRKQNFLIEIEFTRIEMFHEIIDAEFLLIDALLKQFDHNMSR